MDILSILLRFNFNNMDKKTRETGIGLSILLRFNFNDMLLKNKKNSQEPFNPIKVQF